MNKTIIYLYAETLALAGGLAGLSKGLFRRKRPYVYKPFTAADKDDFSAHHSFFSGHEANSAAFCFLTAYLIHHYTRQQKWKGAAWLGAFLLSGTVGYYRYATDKHYLSDVLTGSLIGAGTGILLPQVHKNQLPGKTFMESCPSERNRQNSEVGGAGQAPA